MSEPIKPLDLDFSSLDRRTGDLSEDELFAPADVSEVPSAPVSLFVPGASVGTLTNSPGCSPNASARPIRRARSVRVDAWSAPAPANWGRSRRTVRKVNGQGQGRARSGRKTGVPSSDWALPF